MCTGPNECVGHAPYPTPGNFPIWEMYSDLMAQAKSGMGGFEGFDYVAVKLITETMGHEFNRELYDRLKFLEVQIFEMNQESQ
jgi:hypothetical protein